MKPEIVSLQARLSSIEDPRDIHKIRHRLDEILLIALCAMLCGAEDFTEFETFGEAKASWLRKIGLTLPGGIPSHDTFRKVFMTIAPACFVAFFTSWVRSLFDAGIFTGQIAIDGKWLRQTASGGNAQSAAKLVNAWAVETGLAIGQVRVEEGSNEIAVVPELLNVLHLRGCIVSMDAAHCQVENTRIITSKKGDYVLPAKENQANLHDELAITFTEEAKSGFEKTRHSTHETTNTGHGRREKRTCIVVNDPSYIQYHARENKWHGLKSIAAIQRERWVGDRHETHTTYYISSLDVDAKRMSEILRAHWHVENLMHWQLDVSFHEDDSRVRSKNAPDNLALLRKLCLNLVRLDKTRKLGIKTMRHRAGWDDSYLERLLALARGSTFSHA